MLTKGSFPLLIVGAFASTVGLAPAAAANKSIVGTGVLLDGSGATRGQVTLAERGDGMVLKLTVHGLPKGQHGVHLHMVGSCNAPDFVSAGGHLNPHGKMHGSLNPQGSHLGDLPNLTVGSGGSGSLTARLAGTKAELWQVLFDGDGTSLVVHANGDDYRTDPSGNSGGRIACAAITRIR
ncbi:superoxide dismutase family protein [Novosphingobium sp. G106]|uniref:superoxide dismutase family protein n=1 Tax=Novosphingobium sp. G106 TaxID=2849500 RepID=UPI001C2D39FB|nr:superoxide dismutase family protein [Novosphingobium sp. G106]MBV1689861.1 superoxide dismutase family protein [Novosphingobium sp. G106]